jgi:hypothetical protein
VCVECAKAGRGGAETDVAVRPHQDAASILEPGLARVARLLHRLPETAVIVTAASYDVIAWNALAGALLGELRGQPNLAWRA